MKLNTKSLKTKTKLRGYIWGLTIGLLIQLFLCAAAAYAVVKQLLPQSAEPVLSMIIILLSAYISFWTSQRINNNAIIINCSISAILFIFLQLAVSAIYFQIDYSRIGAVLILILCSAVLVIISAGGQRKGINKRKNFRRNG